MQFYVVFKTKLFSVTCWFIHYFRCENQHLALRENKRCNEAVWQQGAEESWVWVEGSNRSIDNCTQRRFLICILSKTTRTRLCLNIKKIRFDNMHCIQLIWDRDQWKGPINTETNARVPKGWRISWISERLLVSDVELLYCANYLTENSTDYMGNWRE